MKPGIFSFNLPTRAALKLLPLWFAALLATVHPCAGAATYTLLHGFADAPTDGARPNFGSTVIASGSTLFGVTETGGAHSNGVIFAIGTAGGTPKILHPFNGYSLINTNGSKDDGALPFGTPLLVGNTLYGTTEFGGSNVFGEGTIWSINTNGTGFQVLHHFGAGSDGYAPYGSLTLAGSTLYGMTSQGGAGLSEGTIFSIGLDGSNYQVVNSFDAGGSPFGSLLLSGSTLYGMTQGTIFSIPVNSTNIHVLHTFTGTSTDGATPYGSLILSGSTLYGMTSQGGANNFGCAFAINTNGGGFHLIHSFAITEGWEPYGDLTLSSATLYGMTHNGGATNGLGLGTVFQMNTDGSGYQIIHTFTGVAPDGSSPYAPLLLLNSKLYGMTYAGSSLHDAGGVFSLSGGSIGATNGAITVTLAPAGAVAAGAEWQVDGGVFHPSGAVATGLTPGSHLVAFKAVTGWGAPPTGLAGVTVGATNAYLGTYTALDITITEPTAGLNVSNANYTVVGTAHDSVAVANVLYQLNGGGWISATTSNHWTNWTAPVTLVPGTNTIQTFAVDTSGNTSITNTVKFVYVLSAPLSVAILGGNGSVSIPNGALLEIGKSYVITVMPALGFKFVRWTGSTNSTNATLPFTMEPGFALTANLLDIVPPAITITKPTAGLNVSNADYTVIGTAHDNVGVTSVHYSLNGSNWLVALSANANTNWTAPVTLTPGTNTILAFASDAAGNNSVTDKVSFVYVLSAPLAVNIFGGKGTTSIANGTLLAIGKSYIITAVPAAGFKFIGWTGGITTNKATFTFVMEPGLVLTADFLDIVPPVLTITKPTAGLTVSNANYTITGTASDNVGVTSVNYSLNGSGWLVASTANNDTNWTAPVTLNPGTNTILAFASDAAGNHSSTNKVSFVYVLSAPLSVNIVGGKGATSIANGTVLEIGKSYVITATPALGFKFVRWTGSTNSTNATLPFTMEPGFALTANLLDITKPTVSITAPVSGQRVSNANFLVMGTASDNFSLASVSVQLNGGGFNPAHSADNGSNWMIAVALSPGANVVQAYSTDSAGNQSATASVSLDYVTPPDWAPNSLSGLLAEVTSGTNTPFPVAFGGLTFSQNTTNTNDFNAVGTYTYDKLTTNTARLTLTYTLPPNAATNIGTHVIDLTFDAADSGIFMNETTGDSGTVSLSTAPATARASLAGLTISATSSVNGKGVTLTLGAGTGFSQMDSNGQSSAGNYTYMKYSPIVGMIILNYTSPANNAGSTTYVQATFTTTSAGDFFVTSFDNTGNFNSNNEGTFTIP